MKGRIFDMLKKVGHQGLASFSRAVCKNETGFGSDIEILFDNCHQNNLLAMFQSDRT